MNDEKQVETPICSLCYHARPRKNICGVYCTTGFQNKDNTCKHFLDYLDQKAKKSKSTRKNPTAP